MKVAAISRVPQPGGVKERVTKWQQASAAAVTKPDVEGPSTEPDTELSANFAEAEEEERQRIKHRKLRNKKDDNIDRRKSGNKPDMPTSSKKRVDVTEKENVAIPNTPETSKSIGSPKKRIVSDDHWMQKQKKKSPPAKRSPKGLNILNASPLLDDHVRIPKDFLQKNNATVPLADKISSWAQEVEVSPPKEIRSRQTTHRSHREQERTRMSKPDPAILHDDGIRVRPVQLSPEHNEDQIKAESLQSIDDGIRVIPGKSEGNESLRVTRPYGHEQRTSQENSSAKYAERKISGRQKGQTPSHKPQFDDDENQQGDPIGMHQATPTHRRRHRKSASPQAESLADIPVGYSAFSVLEMPVGADARTMRQTMRKPVPRPQRNTSFKAVPQVLKNIFHEGMKMAQDTVTAETPRVGVNQPTSIESWLNSTSDPFVEKPAARADDDERAHVLDDDTATASQLTSNWTDDSATSTSPSFNHEIKIPKRSIAVDGREDKTPPPSPIGLKRSPATRSPVSAGARRKIPLREKLAEAFRGESSYTRSSSSPIDMFEHMSPRHQDSTTKRHATEHQSILARTTTNHESDDSHEEPMSIENRSSFNHSKRQAPTVGHHPLSTIASVASLKTETLTETSLGSLTGTSLGTITESSVGSMTATSVVSDTTITQNTKSSHTSYTGTESSVARGRSRIGSTKSKHGLQRKLTKHSDLMSVLSLPDANQERGKSIRSARSIRTTRCRLEDASIEDLLDELADDEVKYMRELRTLVDGVIPVLLTSVLSKSKAALAAGLLDPDSKDSDTLITKPIVDMGVALEQLKSLHRRIPLQDARQLIAWAHKAHKTYEDYLASWRMGFKDVVVNLAPASRTPSAEHSEVLKGVPCDPAGDVVNSEGDRVDVAFLLKRPLVRIKHLAKITRGFHMLSPTSETQQLKELYEELLAKTRRRAKEEEARQEDQAANNTDATRARDPATLAPMVGVVINRDRQVYMKDFFTFDLQHSSGQRIDCRVEVLLRDKPKDNQDLGDILICEVDTNGRWLLLPPVELNRVSARRGHRKNSVVVLVRGGDRAYDWREVFTLTADDEKTATEWLAELGTTPIPPPLQDPQQRTSALVRQQSMLSLRNQAAEGSTAIAPCEVDVPIGERKNFMGTSKEPVSMSLQSRIAANKVFRDHVVDDSKQRQLSSSTSHMMTGALKHELEKSARSSREQTNTESLSRSAAANTPREQRPLPETTQSTGQFSIPPQQRRSPKQLPTKDLPYIPKLRTTLNTTTSERLLSHKNDQFIESSEQREPSINPVKVSPSEEKAPPPPAHRSPLTPTKRSPILQSSTAKFKNRRSSSPLKHEYQPSYGSDTSDSEASDGYTNSYVESSDEEELEAPELSMPVPVSGILRKPLPPPSSIYSMANDSISPSNSASQGPYRQAPRSPEKPKIRMIASIFAWNDKGHWESMHTEDCEIAVGPGLIEAYYLGADPERAQPASPASAGDSDLLTDINVERPLVALDLTPLVPLRQSTCVDIEMRSPPLPRSVFKWNGSLRFRTHSIDDCNKLYAAIHRARLDNPVFKRLEQERLINSYGGQTYQEVQGSKRRVGSFFGRKNSYRATTRAPSSSISDDQSISRASAFIKRITSGGSFNIDRSTIVAQEGLRHASAATSLYTDSNSGFTPPRTPTSSNSIAESRESVSKVMARGTRDIKIRCYKLVTMSSWGLGIPARLTVEDPPKGMRQASTLYSGLEKRIHITAKASRNATKLRKEGPEPGSRVTSGAAPASHSRSFSLSGAFGNSKSNDDDDAVEYYTVLDTVIGGDCVLRYGRTGIAINVWEDISGPNGEVGMVGAVGGLSGRTRKWMFHFNSQEEMMWIYAVLGGR